MTILEVICTAVAVQNNSQWPCSMCPRPQFRLVGVRTSHIFNISWTPWALDPIINLSFGGPLAAPSYRRRRERDHEFTFDLNCSNAWGTFRSGTDPTLVGPWGFYNVESFLRKLMENCKYQDRYRTLGWGGPYRGGSWSLNFINFWWICFSIMADAWGSLRFFSVNLRLVVSCLDCFR